MLCLNGFELYSRWVPLVKLSEFLLLHLHNQCTCDLSYIASILFAKANFTHVRT